jgi:hypothetical protein
LWLQKRKYERIQGHIMASDSAETSDISKGGAALAAKSAAGGIMGVQVLMVTIVGGGLNQKLTAANGRAANARASATAETMRMANSCQPGWQLQQPQALLPATSGCW